MPSKKKRRGRTSKPKTAGTRKRRAPRSKAAPPVRAAAPPMLDDIIEEPLYDASGVMRVTNKLFAAQRDGDPNPHRLAAEPSLILRPLPRRPQKKGAEPSGSVRLPRLFAAEAQRSASQPKTADDGSLFGSLTKGAGSDDPDDE